jgi:hypothetical protein
MMQGVSRTSKQLAANAISPARPFEISNGKHAVAQRNCITMAVDKYIVELPS